MDIREFNVAYNSAKRRLRADRGADVGEQQARLTELVPMLATEDDRQTAMNLIARLPQRARPSQPDSPQWTEAVRIQGEAFFGGGSTEERLARLAAARKRIWEIAEHAGTDGPSIRGLTRTLEHLEESLTDPRWDFGVPPAGQAT